MFANIKKLIFGNGLAQIIQFVAIVLLSRIYYPSDFALLNQSQSLATMFVVVATLQLHLTIPLSCNRGEALLRASRVEQMAIMLFVIAAFFVPLLDVQYLYAVVLMLCMAISNVNNSYLVYAGDFSRLSKFYVKRAVFIIIAQVIFSLLAVKDGLIWGAVLGELLTVLYLRLFAAKRPFVGFDIREIVSLVRSNFNFSFYGTLQELTSVVAFYSPLFLFAIYFSDEVSGQYSMVNRLVWAPTILISSSIAQVLYQYFGQRPPSAGDKDSIRLLILDKRLLAVIAGGCVLSFFLVDFYNLVLGSQWRLASEMLPWGICWAALFLVATPSRVACRAMLLQKFQLLIDAFVLVAIVLVFFILQTTPINIMKILVVIALFQSVTMIVGIVIKLNRKR